MVSLETKRQWEVGDSQHIGKSAMPFFTECFADRFTMLFLTQMFLLNTTCTFLKENKQNP